jgi:phosphatidate cytidylyltransferase
VLILTFLCAVMINDAAAWFFGMLFGKKNRGIVAASPNKSAAGFIAGYAAAIGVCVGASFLSPAAFTAARFPALLSGVILGLATGFAGTVGDLAESALKRSCGVKDSGALMPGRGGILDSIDSITFAAPVFYLLYNALFILS